MRMFFATLAVIVSVSTLTAQIGGARFDVASVKPVESRPGQSSGYDIQPGGLFATSYPLRWLIAHAYNIPLSDMSYRLIGGPDRLLEAKFTINARAPRNTSRDQVRLMLQSLLADRFKLRLHPETRERPVYALIVARRGQLGDDLRPSKHDCERIGDARGRALRAGDKVPSDIASPRDAKNRQICFNDPGDPEPRGARRHRHAGALAELVMSIQGAADRPIIDATQLTGHFEWQLIYTGARVVDASAGFPSLRIALEEQLGLKLEPRMMPMEVLVIDALEFPTPD